MKETLSSLTEGDEVVINNELRVEYIGSKVQERMDPHAERAEWNRWWFQDSAGRLYEMDDMLGNITFDRDGVHGS